MEASFYLEVAVDLSRYFPSLLSTEGAKRCLAFLLLVRHSGLFPPFPPSHLSTFWKSVSTLPIPTRTSIHCILSEDSSLLTKEGVKKKLRIAKEIRKASPPDLKANRSCTTLSTFSLLVLSEDAYHMRITPSTTLTSANKEMVTLAATAMKRRAKQHTANRSKLPGRPG